MLAAYHLWPACLSPTLKDAHASFHLLTSLPAYAHIPDHTSAQHSTIASLLAHPTLPGASIDALPTIAGRHSQHVFLRVVAASIQSRLYADASLPPPTRARLRHAAAPLSGSLFNVYYLPTPTVLDDSATVILYCHRLGIPLPFAPNPPPARCTHACRHYRTSFPPYLLDRSAHAYHPMSCNRSQPSRHRRHDAAARIIAAAVRRFLGHAAYTNRNLSTSTTTGKKADITITAWELQPPHTKLDATVSSPMLPHYVAEASHDAAALFRLRADEKTAKHLPGCIDLRVAFIPVVFTTFLGVGPTDGRTYLFSIFSPNYTSERASGGTGQETAHHRRTFLQTLLASIHRSTAQMVLAAFNAHAATPLPATATPTDANTTNAPDGNDSADPANTSDATALNSDGTADL